MDEFGINQIYVLHSYSHSNNISFARVIGITKNENPRLELLSKSTTMLECSNSHNIYRVVPLDGGIEVKVAKLDTLTDEWNVSFKNYKFRIAELYDPSKKYEYVIRH